MDFIEIATLFEQVEKRNKRLEKILLLRDFLLKYKDIIPQNNLIKKKSLQHKEAHLVFDIIAGNFQREIDKKTLGISLKTIFGVLSFLSKTTSPQIESLFNRIGDVGEVAIKF